jgi:hypothetical protein
LPVHHFRKSNIDMEDEAKLLADAKKLPLEQRVEHSSWKVRSEAFDDIKEACSKAFSTGDPIFGKSGKRTSRYHPRRCLLKSDLC